jgi:hypothetical protein
MRSKYFCGIVFLVGCAMMTPRQYALASTVGHVGCPRDEIVIVGDPEEGSLGAVNSWEASCRGNVYYCSKPSEMDDVVRCVKADLPVASTDAKSD